MGNRMGNWMSKWTSKWTSNRMGNRIAADEQPKAEECLPFRGRRLVCEEQFFSEGVFLFGGYWRDKKNENPCEAAIRRIKNEECLDGWKDVADKLVHLDHNNILRVFGYEEDVDNGWRYFALEPYSATLYEYCNGKYKGPVPNESQVFYQITNGVSYLHGKGIVHGDLNPLNVVIAAQSRPVRMKISDFGLSKFSYSKQLSEREENINLDVELCMRKYWTLSEKTDSLEGIEDPNEDVIAVGCILFYYLTRGKHLFGNDFKSILINLKEKNPVNLPELGKNHFAYEPIKNMITPPRKRTDWLHVENMKFKERSLQVSTSKPLGSGTYGFVFEGEFNGDRVAIKQMLTTTAQNEFIQREMSLHIELNHVNVVKLLDVADSADNSYTQLVLELCAGTLADYCEKKYSGPDLPPDELVLYQIANGLDYIHSRNLVHRDIKPENILISMTTPIQMKVSDLSFVKKTRQDIFSQSKIRGSFQWMDPERLKILNDNDDNKSDHLPDGTIKSDTFSCGCVFFYFLTRGTHPFGKNQITVPTNILENKREEFDSNKQKLAADYKNGKTLADLIEDMIKYKEEDRIGMPEVIKQLATLLCKNKDNIKCYFQRVDVSLDGDYSIGSYSTEPILARANSQELIFYTAENWSIPFSNWRKKVTCLPQILVGKTVEFLEWNSNRKQLAVGAIDGSLVVWSYPECNILFQRKICFRYDLRSPWNPTRPNLFATFHWSDDQVFIFDSSTGDVITTIDSKYLWAVTWISENRIAVSSFDGKIQIFEMDENNLTTTRLVKEFTHGENCYYLEWNERTQYLASGGRYKINIWSIDYDRPIYSLKVSLEGGWKPLFAWRPLIENGEQEDRIEMAKKSAKNFTFANASKSSGVFIWNPLENEQQPRRLSDDENIRTLAVSPDGRFLAAGSRETLIIWSSENWEQIYKLNFDNEVLDLSWVGTTKSTNVYENKLIINFRQGINLKSSNVILEYAFEAREVSDSAAPTESN